VTLAPSRIVLVYFEGSQRRLRSDSNLKAMPTTSPNAWITCPRPNPQACLRLFGFPYAGGAASAFYTWSDDLPRELEFCPIQLPGRESRLRESPFSHLEPLLEALVPAIRPYLDKPFVFFGHSMGATTNELARRLRRKSGPCPLHLFVSGSRAPQVPNPDPPIHHLPEAELVEELRRFNGTPEAVLQNTQLMQLFLPILRADLTLHETYVYTAGEPLDCPISAFGGSEDEEVTRDKLAAWREQTHGAFTLRVFPGDHFFPRSARSYLLQAVSQDLTQILGHIDGGAGL
jgi:medium-chain acyl-[acyl-carrier-protein] hydrolase